MAAAKIEERGALREKAQEATTPRTLCARKAEDEEEEEEGPDEEEEDEADGKE